MHHDNLSGTYKKIAQITEKLKRCGEGLDGRDPEKELKVLEEQISKI